MQCGLISQIPQGLAHLGKDEFGLVPQTEKCLCAAQFFTLPRDLQNFFWGHSVSACIARIASKCAISAIITAQISKWKKNFTRIGDYVSLESLFRFEGS